MTDYQPPYTITPNIFNLVADIASVIGRMGGDKKPELPMRLRRIQRIRTIQGSLAIEGNTLSTKQITAILDGKTVIAPPAEIQEVRNALNAYDALGAWQPGNEAHLLQAHQLLLAALQESTPEVAPVVTPEVERLLAILTNTMSRQEIQVALGLKDEKNLRERYLEPALAAGLIERTVPDKPTSRLQKYRRTKDAP